MAAYSHERAAKETIHISWIYNINRMKQIIIYLETMKDSNLHLTTIRTVSSSCRCASIYTNRLSLILLWMNNSHFTLDFQSFSCSPDCNVFTSACTDDSSFRCSTSVYLMQISWIFRIACVLSPESRRSLRYQVTSFSTPLFNRCVKELLLWSFPNLSRCKIVAALKRPTL